MKIAFVLTLFGIASIDAVEVKSAPKVQVYSHWPGLQAADNRLICHASGFNPPDISIQLLQDGQEIPGAFQTDLAFEPTWQFHLTKSVEFKPVEGVQYSCRVKHHHDPPKDFHWEPDF